MDCRSYPHLSYAEYRRDRCGGWFTGGGAGLRVPDVVTAIDGTPIAEESTLAQALNRHKPGDTVTLIVVRRNRTVTVLITLAENPPPQ